MKMGKYQHWLRNLPAADEPVITMAEQIELAAMRCSITFEMYNAAYEELIKLEAGAQLLADNNWSDAQIDKARKQNETGKR